MTSRTPDFMADFQELSAHGATPGGGVDRQAGTMADHAARAWLTRWLDSHGFQVRFDAIGNQFGLLEFIPGAPWVLTGSHLDSQPLAGRFDGAYGVLAAAHATREAAQRVASGDLIPTCNVAVVNWFNEEGSRFTPSMMGSAVFTRKLDLDHALSTRDAFGVTVAEALDDAGMAFDFEPPPIAAYAEIHIQQGRSLEASGTTIGLVDRTWAASKYRVVVTGEQSHTGATAMVDRRDALYGAALIVVLARTLSEEAPEGALHASVSQFDLAPNSPVTIARRVELNLDLRSPLESVLHRANARLVEAVGEIERRARVSVEITLTHQWGLLSYHPEGVDLARSAAERLGLSHTEVMTAAGHDSTNLKDVVPTVMLFVPSVDGISHHEAEQTYDQDCIDGVALLTEVVSDLVAGSLGQSAVFVPDAP